jgi:plastocyanin
MNSRQSRTLSILVIAITFTQLGCSKKGDKHNFLFDENSTTVTIGNEGGQCFAEPSWIYYHFNAGDKVTWQSATNMAYTVSFTNSPFTTNNFTVPATPGTYLATVTSAAVNNCTANAAGPCYFPYSIYPSGSVNVCMSTVYSPGYEPGLHIKPTY